MTHREKVDLLIDDLGKKGMNPYTVAPPIFRWLWKAGINIPPPFFLGFFSLALLNGGYFGPAWGAAMWLLFWRGMPLMRVAIFSAMAGIFFGVGMAAYYRWRARRLKLPRWENYPEVLTAALADRGG